MTPNLSLVLALAVNLITAWIVLRMARRGDPQPAPTQLRRRRRRLHRAHRTSAHDPWTIDPDDPEADLVGAAATAAVPVLAYIDVPRRSHDPERLIQTEVLQPSGSARWGGAFLRLALAVLFFGAALGFGIIGAVRAVGWFIRRLGS